MAVFVLEDLQDSIEVMVFPRAMQDHGHKLADDAIVTVKARVDKRDETPEAHRHGDHAVRGLRRGRPAAAAQAARRGALRGAHRPPQGACWPSTPGESPVFLHLGEGKVLRLPDEYRVDLPRVVGELRVAFGHDAVVL